MSPVRFVKYRDAITAEYARECLIYSPETGEFQWRWRPREHFKRNQVYLIWNAKYSGNIAGMITREGYRKIGIDSVNYQAHRLGWLIVNGVWPESGLDHVNLNRSDNRLSNLREADQTQNNGNTPLRKNNNSGIKGVYWHSAARKWCACIRFKGVCSHLGTFSNIDEAASAYKIAAEKYFGEFARVS